MKYEIELLTSKPEYKKVSVLDTVYTLIWDGERWTVGDFDECPVSSGTESRVKNILEALSII